MSRSRQTDPRPAPQSPSPEKMDMMTRLNEVAGRFLDMVNGLSCQHWNAPVSGFWGTIAQLTAHCIRNEASWVARLSGNPRLELIRCRLATEESHHPSHLTPREMVAEARRCRAFTEALLKNAGSLDEEQHAGPHVMTVRGVLHHQMWHWAFHHGQVNMIQQILGIPGCRWKQEEKIAPGR